MKTILLAAASFLAASSAAQGAPATLRACWLETSAAKVDGAMGGAGLRETPVWNSTISSVLVRHAKGDVLIDTGFGPQAAAQMSELPAAGKAFGLQILSGAKDRKSIRDALATVHESPARVSRILVTHAHYDHLGGATELSAPIYISAAEAKWMADHPDILASISILVEGRLFKGSAPDLPAFSNAVIDGLAVGSCGSAAYVDIVGVTGSIPVASTNFLSNS